MKTKLFSLFTVLLASLCLAGDDFVASVSYTATAACSAQLRAKTRYAVRCTTDCHVMVSSAVSVVPTTEHVLVAAGKLYDVPTTSTQTYICAVQSAAAGAMKIYLNRGPTE